jgi:hypothetical protein
MLPQKRADQERIVVVPELGQHVVRNSLNRGRRLAEDLSLTLIVPIIHPVNQVVEQVSHPSRHEVSRSYQWRLRHQGPLRYREDHREWT